MMLKKIIVFLLFAAICQQSAANTPAPEIPEKANTAPAAVPPVRMTAPALENPQSWSMVIVPDIQTYIKQIENHGILDMMLAWIVRRRAEMNIQQVLFTGDLVYYNDTFRVVPADGIGLGRMTDLVAHEQWEATSRLLKRLDGQLPYVLCTGNHDYGVRSAENRKTRFNHYFPTDRNPLTRRQLVECGANAFGEHTLENSAYEFTAPHPDNRKFLIITLQFAPTDADLKWAKSVADHPRFAKHIGIVLTHSYLRASGVRVQQEKYLLSRQGGNGGEGIFQKLVYPAKNIRMVICGHVCRPDSWEHAVGFSMDKNSSGASVAQMVFNTQAIGGGFSGSGGDGWLRLLEFMPDGKTVKARTFSPYFFRSPSTRHLAWKQDQRNEFTFVLE
jgi:hypothetical protein